MKTLQEIFDISCIGLLIQGKQSMSEGEQSGCAYFGENGGKCAVGQLLPPGTDTCKFEGLQILVYGDSAKSQERQKLLLDALVAGGVNVADDLVMKLLGDLQETHDYAYMDEGRPWRTGVMHRWEELAKKYGLTMYTVKEEAEKFGIFI